MGLTSIPQNYKKNVDWVCGAYEDAGVSFANGFQKDAIQNSVGARKSSSSWENWQCSISVVNTPCGKHIVVEDSGTVGLTGKIIPVSEIDEMMSRDEKLPATERLSRFSSMYNSGGNEAGGGLYGAGKSVYAAASSEYTYYYDSLREDGTYVANVNLCGRVNSIAFVDEEAKKFIFDNTGLGPKTTTGTRVIIVSPREELVEAIEGKSIVPFIQESWWIILKRLPKSASIVVNGERVSLPDGLVDIATHKFELTKPELVQEGYRVKHFGLYVYDEGGSPFEGISYYRKGMKIGQVDIKDIPKTLAGKYWGYIEVEEQWEKELEEIEDRVHFGVSRYKKTRSAYQNIRIFCAEKVKANLAEWGYISDRENEDKRLKEQLKQIAEEAQDLFDRLGFEDLGKGPKKPDFDVRWMHIEYPAMNTEKVTKGDSIRFSYRVRSSYSVDKRFECRLFIVNQQTGETVYSIANDELRVASNTSADKDFCYTVSDNTAARFCENRIVLVVKAIGSNKEKRKELPFFFDVDKPDNTRDRVSLVLHGCKFPIEGSRRVNFGEDLKDISYLIENKRNCVLKYQLRVSVHNASSPSCDKIVDVATISGSLPPYEETITSPIERIVFDRGVYEQYLSEGVLELRARLIADADDEQFEKGDKITYYYYKVFLNCDEKSGNRDSFDVRSTISPDDFRRSWCQPGNGRSITLNVGHRAYLMLSDNPDIQHEYIREEMLKQLVLLYLAEGRFDMFGEAGEFINLEPQDAVNQVISKIESVYAQSLK